MSYFGSDAGGARAHDLTTFVSATGPGAQPQIMKNSGTQKKNVQIQDAKGWADLSKGAVNPKDTEKAAGEENDTLWTEFKGREEEQNILKEQRKALEKEEARKKLEAEAEAARKAEEEKRLAEEKAAEAKRREEDLRKKEAAELANMNTQAEEDAELDMMRQVGHEEAEDHLDEMGLAADAEDDNEDASDEEAMDI
jgi:hypothetical protein